MQAADVRYAATKRIMFNGVIAYQPGDVVSASAVEGDDAWLRVGEDVEPLEETRLDRPAKSASQAAWAAYAVSVGADEETAAGMSRTELIARYGSDEPAAAAGSSEPDAATGPADASTGPDDNNTGG